MLQRRNICGGGVAFSGLEGQSTAGTKAPLIIWSHATGFHSAAYAPLLQALLDKANVLAVDARGHGETAAPAQPDLLRSWHPYYQDLADIIDEIDPTVKVILVGHSMGATASAFVASMRPRRISGMVLIEPVFYPPGTGTAARKALMAGARKRRATFPSLQDAFDSYRPRAAFRTLSDEWLWSYVNGAFVETPESVFTLRCTPAWEHRTFELNERWPWWAIARVRAPTTVLLADSYSSCPPAARRIMGFLQPRWRQMEVAGSSHLLPMETPQPVVDAVFDMIAQTAS